MDAFKYQIALAELNNCKYAKDLNILVRKYHIAYKNSNDYLESKYHYKLYALSLNLYALKSKAKLPDFLYDSHTYAQRYVIKGVVTNDSNYLPLQEYSELVDFFEFDTIVETLQYTNDSVPILHDIVLDKPLHFKFKFNERLSSFDTHSLNSMPLEIKKYIHAIRLKQTLSPNTPATVLEQYLEATLAEIPKHTDVSNDIVLLQQQTKALQTYQSTYGEYCGKL